MKNIYLTLFVAFYSFISLAQICIPDNSFTSPGYYPDSLSPATIGASYEQVVTIIVPSDTVIELIPGVPSTLPIDSIVVTSISNLPPGFSYACEPSSCSFTGGSTNCMIVTGTPLTGAGEYNLIVNVDAYSSQAAIFGLSPLAETINFGKFTVFDNVGVETIENSNFKIESISPQPFQGSGFINLTSPTSGNLSLDFIDVLGKKVASQSFLISKGSSKIQLNQNLSAGLYFVIATLDRYSYATKFVVAQ